MCCNKCGNEVNEHDVFCVKCGNKLHEGDLFCSKCGSDVESAVVVADDQETKYGFIENLEGVRIKKIILAIVGLIIVGGVIAGTVMMSNDNENRTPKQEQMKVTEEQTDTKNEVDKNLLDRIYGDYLAAYREYEESGFEEYPYEYEMISDYYPILMEYGECYDFELYYAFVDLANDGIPELFIGDKEMIYDTAMPVSSENFDLTYVADPGGAFLGERAFCDICSDNILREEGTGGASYNTATYSKLGKDTCKPVSGYGVEMDGEKCYSLIYNVESQEFIKDKEISTDEYWDIWNNYKTLEGITWNKLSDYKSSKDVFMEEIRANLEVANSCLIEEFCVGLLDGPNYLALFDSEEEANREDRKIAKLVERPYSLSLDDLENKWPGFYGDPAMCDYMEVDNFDSIEDVKTYLNQYITDDALDSLFDGYYESVLNNNLQEFNGKLYLVRGGRGYGAVTYDIASAVYSERTGEKRYVNIIVNLFDDYDHTETIEFSREGTNWIITDIEKYDYE